MPSPPASTPNTYRRFHLRSPTVRAEARANGSEIQFFNNLASSVVWKIGGQTVSTGTQVKTYGFTHTERGSRTSIVTIDIRTLELLLKDDIDPMHLLVVQFQLAKTVSLYWWCSYKTDG